MIGVAGGSATTALVDDGNVVWAAFGTTNRRSYPADVARWHALDAPLRPFKEWAADLETGVCTRCGQPARRGDRHWWHVSGDGCWTRHGCRWPTGARAQFRGN